MCIRDRLDLSRWRGERTREVLWGCEYPPASEAWFVYLPAHGYSWWLIGEVEDVVEMEDVPEAEHAPQPL